MKPLAKSTVLIAGLGQIGGSIAIDLKRNRAVACVLGFDPNTRIVRRAIRAKVIDRAVSSVVAGLQEADVIILAAPIHVILETLPDVLGKLRPHQLCIDVAGSKRRILKIADGSVVSNFVGGHPIAGTERRGFAGAAAGLFTHSTFILVPARKTSGAALVTARSLVRALGARPLVMKAEQHDRSIAYTSHLPYAMALALTGVVGFRGKNDPQWRKLVGGSFRSATRVAGSSPELTVDMLLSNSTEVGRAIDACVSELRKIKKWVLTNDETRLREYVDKSCVEARQMAKESRRRK